MITSNYHIHTNYCDGKNTAAEMAKAAFDAGLTDIGFSSHAPLKYDDPDPWTMREDDVSAYFADVAAEREKYAGKMRVATGLEVDYYLDTQALSDLGEALVKKLDYFIGSIHCIGNDADGVYYFDDTPRSMAAGIDRIYGGSVRDTVSAYYEGVARMAKTVKPDIIGHFDLIKKNNILSGGGTRFFDENDAYYVDAWHDALAEIAKTDCIVEINTGGVYRFGEGYLYPAEAMIDAAIAKKIPFTVSGDSHEIGAVDFGFRAVSDMLLAKGVKAIMVLTDDGWQPRAI